MGAIHSPLFGEALGPELITNGDFASSASWVTPSTWVISGGAATYTVGASGPMYQDYAPSVNAQDATYLLTFTLAAGPGEVFINLVGDIVASSATRSGVGTYSEYLTLPGYYSRIRVHATGSGDVFLLDISLKRVY